MKRLWIVAMTALFLFVFLVPVQAESPFQIKRKDQITQDWEIHVDYPLFDQLKNKQLQETVNHKITEKLEQQMQMVERSASEVLGVPILYYEESHVIKDGDFYSVIMTSNVSKGEQYYTSVTSVNFTTEGSGEIKRLKKLVDMQLLSEEIKKAAARNETDFKMQKFVGVRPDTAYYIKEGKLVLIFNKYEIAAGVYGTPEVEVPLEKVMLEKKSDETNAPFPSIT